MLSTNCLTKEYSVKINRKKQKIHALRGVSIEIGENEIVSLVGKSGSGKSTLGRLLSSIERPSSGQIWLDNVPVSGLDSKQLFQYRSKVQLVMQDAVSSLEPRQTVSQILDEPLKLLLNLSKLQRVRRKKELMNMVCLSEDTLFKLPHEMSGGQQKRVCIARAMAALPKYIIFDESFSGLDVIVRKQILELLLDIKKRLKISYLIITHDLDLAMFISDSIYVMKDGIIEENLSNPASFEDFSSDYAKKLIKALLSKRQALNNF